MNSSEGVFLEVEGEPPLLAAFLQRLEREKPAIARILSLEHWVLDPVGFTRFEIRESTGGAKTTLILPDLATCADCLRDIADPANRRYRYPFTNCTNCGPRFTIIESLPYDRPRTTMKKFVMCEECAAEYHDPANRRFHAQPNACSKCGPQVKLWNAAGATLASQNDAMLAAAQIIRDGGIVAVKGLGGFHLMVDARSEQAVLKLRQRKRREEKPFALMYPSLEAILDDCECSEIETRLLRSPESPIVLVRRRSRCALPQAIAPGNPYLGVMVPYTPLHHILLGDLGFPVIATSGNLSEEPICTDQTDALERLHGIADCFLVHDRPILRHVDDSIVREMAGRELVLRRARGFAPLPVTLPEDAPVLMAVGGHQKNTIAAAVGRQVFISQHIGDLETAQSLSSFERVNAAFRQLYELKPAALACDLHPDYSSTQYAQGSGERVVAVQHHYAHALSCMAENELRPPVLAITWDGSGYGPDGTVWGGEVLRIVNGGYERFAHLRTFRLPGGEKAVKEPRRVALAILYEIFGEDAFSLDLPPLRAFSPAEMRVLRAMLRGRVNSPVTSSAGRLFDAVASLVGIRQMCAFEGQAAMELEFAAGAPSEGAPHLPAFSRCGTVNPTSAAQMWGTSAGDAAYPFEFRPGKPAMVLDWEPMIRSIIPGQESPPIVARKFHHTLACMMVAAARQAGERKVVLSGGCFQNRCLTETAIESLKNAGFQPYWHQRVPPNDGGLSLGQIAAAVAQWKE